MEQLCMGKLLLGGNLCQWRGELSVILQQLCMGRHKKLLLT